MSAFDWIEMLMKGAVIVFLIFCLPWSLLFKPLPRQLEPFEYFAYGGSTPKRWLVAEHRSAAFGSVLQYSDGHTEFVGKARLRRP